MFRGRPGGMIFQAKAWIYAELRGYFEKLASGGMVGMPLEKAPWGDTFGMLTDKFGINWMVNITGQPGM